jgi:hypothetical protein
MSTSGEMKRRLIQSEQQVKADLELWSEKSKSVHHCTGMKKDREKGSYRHNSRL